jgi:hypothetical protein
MLDLSALQTWLQGLGSWGYLLAAALPVVMYLLKQKLGTPAAPALPTAPASPATNPLNLGPQFPLLNLLLQGLGIVKKGASGTTNDIPHTLLMQIDGEVQQAKDAKAAAHTAALVDLGAVPGPLETPVMVATAPKS